MGLLNDLPMGRSDADNRCTIAQIKLVVDQDDREFLDRALDSEVSSAKLAQALKAKNFKTSSSSIGRHRRGECSCPRNEDDAE